MNQRLITRYARYAALKNALEKWLAEKREGIVKALEGGANCPNRGPYLLELSYGHANVDWKEEFRAHLRSNGWTEEWVEEKFAKIEAQPRKRFAKLLSKVNPGYRGKVVVKLPPA